MDGALPYYLLGIASWFAVLVVKRTTGVRFPEHSCMSSLSFEVQVPPQN